MSPIPAPAGQRLTDADIDRLDDLLEQRAMPNDGMSLEMLDGFLSALVVGPKLVMPSEYWSHIWNGEPVWQDETDAREAQRLIGNLWNDIVTRLQIDLPSEEDDDDAAGAAIEAAMPLLALPEADEDADENAPFGGMDPEFPVAAAWAVGFMRGVSLRADDWAVWENEDEQIAEDLLDIARLTVIDADQAKELDLDADDLLDFGERMEVAGTLPFMLDNFNAHRLEGMRPQTVRRVDAPQRNDPCPCGSGKKFKKCCGDPGRLN